MNFQKTYFTFLFHTNKTENAKNFLISSFSKAIFCLNSNSFKIHTQKYFHRCCFVKFSSETKGGLEFLLCFDYLRAN